MSSPGDWIRRLLDAVRSWRSRGAHALRRLYYRYFFRIGGSGEGSVDRLVARLEKRRELYDVPMDRQRWERDFEAGYWSYMREVEEAPRYAVVVAYLRVLVPGGDVLDVGCGEGILLRHLNEGEMGTYLGLDLSTQAIRRARARAESGRHFAVADAEIPPVERRWNAIVLNEVLYYLDRPLAAVARYRRMLQPEGLVIVSTYHGSPRATGILRRLRETLPPEAESITTSAGNSWTCSVFRPGER